MEVLASGSDTLHLTGERAKQFTGISTGRVVNIVITATVLEKVTNVIGVSSVTLEIDSVTCKAVRDMQEAAQRAEHELSLAPSPGG